MEGHCNPHPHPHSSPCLTQMRMEDHCHPASAPVPHTPHCHPPPTMDVGHCHPPPPMEGHCHQPPPPCGDGPPPPSMQHHHHPIESNLLTDTLHHDDFIQREPNNCPGDQKCPPCYLPSEGDLMRKEMPEPMGPIGPWATGRVDWSPLGGLTGTRPVVDHYSITRYSTNEWKKRNANTMTMACHAFHRSNISENHSKNTMVRTFAVSDQVQNDNTKRLVIRAKDVEKWKNTIERAIRAQAEEISLMEEQRQRLKNSLLILKMPESIATECLDRRCGRYDAELIRDKPEEELIKEIALIAEIRDLFLRTLADVTAQQVENRTARERLEFDWSDKKTAFEIESINCGLHNNSTTILFKPGATRLPTEQSSEEYYEHFSKETLEVCEICRQKSVTLRGTLDAILTNAARDLRTQADKVERALANRITCLEELRVRLENELQSCLRSIANTEIMITKIKNAIKSMDYPMKVAQTRLDNRNKRPHVENCRDYVQHGLIDEVKTIQDGVSALMNSLREAELTREQLLETRSRLEKEIIDKRRTIMIDRNRCQHFRSFFPSASALSGY